MDEARLVVGLGSTGTRLLLVIGGAERLRATLPASDWDSVTGLVNALAGTVGELSVVLFAEGWGDSAGPNSCISCGDDMCGCFYGEHLDCRRVKEALEGLREFLHVVGDA
jgi:hypothetical protein